jgi:hypothetical protein
MAYYIYLVNDPVNGPTHGQKTGKDSTIVFRSMGYTSHEAPAAFELRFEPSFAGKFVSSESTQCGKTSGDAPVVFRSQRASEYHEVRIKLKGNVHHPDQGYKYDVVMSGKVWDPRVVPR